MKSSSQALQSKLKDLKHLLNKTLKFNLEKDLKIERKDKEIELLKRNCVSCFTAKPSAEATLNVQFSSFSQHFSSEELMALRSIENDPGHDPTFIRIVLSYLYKADLKVLQLKSLTGSGPKLIKRKNGTTIQTVQKQPLTPSKVHILKCIYHERVKAVTNNEVNISQRIKERHVNQLIATALGNIIR